MMANQEQLAQLKRDVKRWNQWRTEHLETSPDLVGGAMNDELGDNQRARDSNPSR